MILANLQGMLLIVVVSRMSSIPDPDHRSHLVVVYTRIFGHVCLNTYSFMLSGLLPRLNHYFYNVLMWKCPESRHKTFAGKKTYNFDLGAGTAKNHYSALGDLAFIKKIQGPHPKYRGHAQLGPC